MTASSFIVHDNGVVEVVDVDEYLSSGFIAWHNNSKQADVATCGACGRSWDDAVSTAITPTPSARCPFEYDHPKESTPAMTITAHLYEDADTFDELELVDGRCYEVVETFVMLDGPVTAFTHRVRLTRFQFDVKPGHEGTRPGLDDMAAAIDVIDLAAELPDTIDGIES